MAELAPHTWVEEAELDEEQAALPRSRNTAPALAEPVVASPLQQVRN